MEDDLPGEIRETDMWANHTKGYSKGGGHQGSHEDVSIAHA